MKHDPDCYVKADPITELMVAFDDSCRICDWIQQLREKERNKIATEIMEFREGCYKYIDDEETGYMNGLLRAAIIATGEKNERLVELQEKLRTSAGIL